MKTIKRLYIFLIAYIGTRSIMQKFFKSSKLGNITRLWARKQIDKFQDLSHYPDFHKLKAIAYGKKTETSVRSVRSSDLTCKELFALCKDMKIKQA